MALASQKEHDGRGTACMCTLQGARREWLCMQVTPTSPLSARLVLCLKNSAFSFQHGKSGSEGAEP
eukprot:1143072-Pelagomonas_calceolata.AAC.3